MQIEQFVMAYRVEQDRLRALLPEGFTSLRPVLRINAEIRMGEETCCDMAAEGYVEFNTPVEKDSLRGWLNIAFWENVPFEREGNRVTLRTEVLEISFAGTGLQGSCPAEKENDGCFFLGAAENLRLPETITVNKEYCDCAFRWKFTETGAFGESEGKTLPAFAEEVKTAYPKRAFTAENAAEIPCCQVLGTYKVLFERSER